MRNKSPLRPVTRDSETAVGTAVQITTAGNEPPATSFDTTSTINTAAGLSGNPLYLPGRNLWFSGYAAPSTVTTTRHFIGLSNGSVSTQGASPCPAGLHYAGFIFDTGGSTCNGVTLDATHYYILTNNAGTPTIAVTTVSATAAVGHKFDIREDSTGAKWWFYIDGVSVGSTTTALPTLALKQMALETNLVAAAQQVNFSWLEVWSDK